jgi:uncharacterized protein (DUF433 family)
LESETFIRKPTEDGATNPGAPSHYPIGTELRISSSALFGWGTPLAPPSRTYARRQPPSSIDGDPLWFRDAVFTRSTCAPSPIPSDDAAALRSYLSDNENVMNAITRDPETMHGVPVFRGTRVPVQTLFDYLEGGDTLEQFLEGFPTVPRELALEALQEAKQLLLARV